MQIADNKVVKLHYTLKNPQGGLIESSVGQEPLEYIHGVGTLISGLEAALVGKAKGDKVSVVVKPADGYGERDEELVEIVKKAEFEPEEELTLGKEFQYDDEDGNIFHVRITKIDTEDITVDGNHPLAGQTLHFEVEILDVREATAEELDHGHVHGEGGHHHHD